MIQHNVSLYLMTDGTRTVAEAVMIAASPAVYGEGGASREPGDKQDQSIGDDLAVARALHSLASRLERRAHGAVKHAESNKAHKTEIALRKAAEEHTARADEAMGRYDFSGHIGSLNVFPPPPHGF